MSGKVFWVCGIQMVIEFSILIFFRMTVRPRIPSLAALSRPFQRKNMRMINPKSWTPVTKCPPVPAFQLSRTSRDRPRRKCVEKNCDQFARLKLNKFAKMNATMFPSRYFISSLLFELKLFILHTVGIRKPDISEVKNVRFLNVSGI